MNTTPLHELYLAAIVTLSLVLPLMAGALAPKKPANAKPWMRTVWAGQVLGAFGAALAICLPLHPAFGLAVAIAGCAICGRLLRQQLRSAENRTP